MRACLAVSLFLVLAGCRQDRPTSPTDAAAPVVDAPEEEDDDVRPVYPAETGPVPPRVRRLCRALHELPTMRRATCCERKPGILLTSECERNLAGALATEGVTLAEADVAKCEAAVRAQHEGCDWVAPSPLPTPKACLGILEGTRPAGGACRSTLECPPGLRCHGLSPTEPGRCGPPAPAGVLCNTGGDPLVTYARQDQIERTRPACAGYCDRNRCRPALADGATCVSNVPCGPGRRCHEGRCRAGARAARGEPCLGGDCQEGLACAAKRCVAPKPSGAACEVDGECQAVCRAGRCTTTCDTAPVLKKLSKPLRPAGRGPSPDAVDVPPPSR